MFMAQLSVAAEGTKKYIDIGNNNPCYMKAGEKNRFYFQYYKLEPSNDRTRVSSAFV